MSVLCYHSVEPGWRSALAVPPAAFAAHCAWLAANRRPVHLKEAVARTDRRGRPRDGRVALTFDDGFAGLHEHAFPVLARYRLPATMFLVAKTLMADAPVVDWLDGTPPPPRPLRTLTLDQVLEMQDAGIGFGSHSLAHRDLTTLDEGECERDLRDSRELLEDLLRRPIRFLAYPWGRHDERVRRAAARAGFVVAFTLPESREAVGPFALPRVGVYPGNGRLTLWAKSSAWYMRVGTTPAFRMLSRALRGRGDDRRAPY